MKHPAGTCWTFGDFVVDTNAAQLRRQGLPVELRPKSLEVLALLAQSAERVLSRDEIAAQAWPGRVATDESIARCISDIRRALADGDQRLLQTVPRRGYVLKVPVLAISPVSALSSRHAVGAPTERPSIVVRPFVNDTSDARLDMLTRGFTEDITAGLTRYAQLFVLGRESARAFGEGAPDARSMGHAAGVRFVVEGSLRWAPGRLRVSVRLVQAGDEAVIWAERYDGPDVQWFTFQDEIVARIVSALVESVDRLIHQQSRHGRTESLSAYELFLRARELRRSHAPPNALAAELLLERAILLDPDFAPAHAELAFLQHFLIGTRSRQRGRSERLETGFRHARRALGLAPDLPFASQAMGNLHLRAHDHAEADHWARRAITLGPGDSESYVGLANVLQFAGRSEEALNLMEIAGRYNPVRPPMHEFNLARALAWTGRFEQALPVVLSSRSRAPTFWPCTMVLTVTLAHLGSTSEAAAALADWRSQCGFEAPQDYLDHGDTVPGPELDRLREGLHIAGLRSSRPSV